ncbi:hypothetical protein FDW96_22715 [Citrobacter sp. TBCS-15]|nr:hypothetical protein FDW96_22715 [Citrobacter sp. TBCS-15]TKU04481.1 hypothetical protein FDW89_00180 [Citrobacter sp. wls830]TKU51628.1 hypothetical protein FDX11_04425 [Citrobacter sp. wls714]TKU68654.1 hypothetical protein FDX14_23570 [Citrobacter sp. wls710]TKV17250.1 hypothetical protein FDX04_00040 [Citrobacter sp. wls615]
MADVVIHVNPLQAADRENSNRHHKKRPLLKSGLCGIIDYRFDRRKARYRNQSGHSSCMDCQSSESSL